VLGKYLGLVLTLLINLSVMAAAFYAVLLYLDMTTLDAAKTAWETPALDPRMLKAFALIGVELMLITATAIFFSTFSSPFLSVALTFAVYIIGHFGEDLKNINTIVHSLLLPYITTGVYYVMPNLSALDVKSAVVHGLPVSGTSMMLATASCTMYIATLLVGSILIFSRRDLK
jgi:ABC-type transport system involved in multi-copper enzyme maturation permease subunit